MCVYGPTASERGGWIIRVQASPCDMLGVESRSSQANDLHNWYVLLPSLMFCIIIGYDRIG